MSTLQEKIQSRQNEEIMLKIQYTARHYYNYAEKANYYAWVCCLISACTLLFMNHVDYEYQVMAPLLFDILAYFLTVKKQSNVEKASKFRKYFDAYALDIENNYSKSERDSIVEAALEFCTKHISDCDTQINNTAQDDPPGVKDWYDLSKEYSDEDVQFECQLQNRYWEDKLSRKKLVLFAITLISLYIIMVIFAIDTVQWHQVVRIGFSSALILKTAETVKEGIQHYNICKEIDGAIKVMRDYRTQTQIIELQKLIDELRKCNYIGVNLIHKMNASLFSSNYRELKKY